jgi:hypothetical protein
MYNKLHTSTVDVHQYAYKHLLSLRLYQQRPRDVEARMLTFVIFHSFKGCIYIDSETILTAGTSSIASCTDTIHRSVSSDWQFGPTHPDTRYFPARRSLGTVSLVSFPSVLGNALGKYSEFLKCVQSITYNVWCILYRGTLHRVTRVTTVSCSPALSSRGMHWSSP